MKIRIYFFSVITTIFLSFGCQGSVQSNCAESACSEAQLNQSIGGNVNTPNYVDELSSVAIVKGDYDHLDPNHIVPDKPLQKAVKYYDEHFDEIKNKRWISIADMSQHSSKKRLYLIDMISGAVKSYRVSHGSGSDPDADGVATLFSNVNDSRMTSLGFYLTAETYIGAHDYSLRVDGLESTNSLARERAIVIHGADYVSESDGATGRSWGCPAMDNSVIKGFIDKVKNGSLYLIYSDFKRK